MMKKPIPPRLKGHFLLGSAREFLSDPIGQMRKLAQLGDVSSLRLGPKTLYSVCHPELVRQILVDESKKFQKSPLIKKLGLVTGNGLLISDGAQWQLQRRIASPIFTPKSVESFHELMRKASLRLVDRWANFADGTEIDMLEEMTWLSIDVLSNCLFSTESQLNIPKIHAAVKIVMHETVRRMSSPISMPLFLPTQRNRSFKQAMIFLNDLINSILTTKKQQHSMGTDLLGQWYRSQDRETGYRMSDQEIRDEAMTVFIAGHETISSALTWTFYLLGTAPDINERLDCEIRTILGMQPIHFQQLPKFELAARILQESLRLYPQPPTLFRTPIEDVKIADYTIPAGSDIIISTYALHYDPRFWSTPEVFNPDRFCKQENEPKHPFSYLPFGAGPRICIGKFFAWQEALIALITLKQNFQLELVNRGPVELEILGSLQPKGGLKMRIYKRRLQENQSSSRTDAALHI